MTVSCTFGVARPDHTWEFRGPFFGDGLTLTAAWLDAQGRCVRETRGEIAAVFGLGVAVLERGPRIFVEEGTR
jgi:hypothetical protein